MDRSIKNISARGQERFITFMQKHFVDDPKHKRRSFRQSFLLENIPLLFAAFPERCREPFKDMEKINLNGLCKGLAIAFEEAYLTDNLNSYLSIYTAIASWDKSSSALTQETLDCWFGFVDKILLYQSGADLVKTDPILAVGSTHLYRPIKDKRCLFGYFDPMTIERVLNNSIIEDTMQDGMVLIYFPCQDNYHAVSIRKLKKSWYLYDSNQDKGVKYFNNVSAFGAYLVSELSSTLTFIFINFSKVIKPNKELAAIANSIDRLHGEAFNDLFMMQEHNPIFDYDQILKKEVFEQISPFMFFGRISKYECTPLHVGFIRKCGHLFIPLFKYGLGRLTLALQMQDKNGYTPFMLMFIHNSDVANEVLEILYQYCSSELPALFRVFNCEQENALYLASFFSPGLVLQIFERLPDYKSELIKTMMSANKFGCTALWAFCKQAKCKEIKGVASFMPEIFCALPEYFDNGLFVDKNKIKS